MPPNLSHTYEDQKTIMCLNRSQSVQNDANDSSNGASGENLRPRRKNRFPEEFDSFWDRGGEERKKERKKKRSTYIEEEEKKLTPLSVTV